MLLLSDRFTQATGSVGGSTFSHNRFGLYVRARRKPVNTNTSYQQTVRGHFSTASSQWRGLTAEQRAAWDAWAAATPVVNSLGQTVFLTGAQQYVAHVAFVLLLGISPDLADPPATTGRQDLGDPVVVIDQSAASIAITGLSQGVETVGVFLGDAQSAGVKFFNGPYQLRGQGQPTAGALTLTTQSGRNGVTFVTGARIPWRLAGVDGLQRLSTIATGIVTVTA